MQHILVTLDDKVTAELSAVELCKVFENSHSGVVAAAIVRRADVRFPEDLWIGDFYSTPDAHRRLDPDA